MKATSNFRTVVFKRAFLLVKRSRCTFAEALTEAWAEYNEHREILQDRDKMIAAIPDILKVFESYHSKHSNGLTNIHWQPVSSQVKRELNEKLRSIFI